MTKAEIETALEAEYQYATRQVLDYADRMNNVARMRPILEALLAVPGIEDVERSYLGVDYKTNGPKIELYLKQSAQDSHFVREAVKLLHVTFVKESSGETLRCHADILGVTVGISNYLPEGCRIEYHDELIPARTERRAKVICNQGEDA